MNENLLYSLFEIRKNFITTSLLSDLRYYIDDTILDSNNTQLMVSYDNYEKKREIKTVIRRLIEKQYKDLQDKSKGIHLVLESRKLS